MDNIKNSALWATGGAVLGSVFLMVLNSNQVQIADHYATLTAAVATGVAALATAMSIALKKKP